MQIRQNRTKELGNVTRLIVALLAIIGLIVGFAQPAAAMTAQEDDESSIPPLKIMPLGDSITWGAGAGAGTSYSGYRAPLQDLINKTNVDFTFVGSVAQGTNSEPANEGHPGWRIDQIQSIAFASVRSFAPDVVLLHIGTNDINQNFQLDDAGRRLSSLVETIRAAKSDVKILLAPLIASSDKLIQQKIDDYNISVKNVADEQYAQHKDTFFIKEMATVLSADTGKDLNDSVHPTDSGYKKMATAWMKYLSLSQVLYAKSVALGAGYYLTPDRDLVYGLPDGTTRVVASDVSSAKGWHAPYVGNFATYVTSDGSLRQAMNGQQTTQWSGAPGTVALGAGYYLTPDRDLVYGLPDGTTRVVASDVSSAKGWHAPYVGNFATYVTSDGSLRQAMNGQQTTQWSGAPGTVALGAGYYLTPDRDLVYGLPDGTTRVVASDVSSAKGWHAPYVGNFATYVTSDGSLRQAMNGQQTTQWSGAPGTVALGAGYYLTPDRDLVYGLPDGTTRVVASDVSSAKGWHAPYVGNFATYVTSDGSLRQAMNGQQTTQYAARANQTDLTEPDSEETD